MGVAERYRRNLGSMLVQLMGFISTFTGRVPCPVNRATDDLKYNKYIL